LATRRADRRYAFDPTDYEVHAKLADSSRLPVTLHLYQKKSAESLKVMQPAEVS